MTQNQKCRAKGGAAQCVDPNCPEKRETLTYSIPTEIARNFKLFEEQQPEHPTGWENEKTELLRTIHGSTLYGLNHANSDTDWYAVTPSPYLRRRVRKQSIRDGIDTMVVDFRTFTEMCSLGAPQALEAMYSRKAESEYFQDYRDGYRAASPTSVHTYLRTIRAFAMNEEKNPFKSRRHALRLCYNLEELLYTGQFNPTLPNYVIPKITDYAQKPFPEYVKELEAFSPLVVGWGENFEKRLAAEK